MPDPEFGAGKSCAVSVVLRSILDELPNGHVVLLDPHNEYASAFADRAELLNPSNLQLPYWLLNFEEIGHILIGGSANEYAYAQTAILKNAILRAKRAFMGDQEGDEQVTVDTPMPYRLSDLIAALNAILAREGLPPLALADGRNMKIRIIKRDTLEELTNFGDGGRQPGQFYAPHSIAVDSKGNLYTTETYEGKRVQRFLYKGLRPVPGKEQGVVWPR